MRACGRLGFKNLYQAVGTVTDAWMAKNRAVELDVEGPQNIWVTGVGEEVEMTAVGSAGEFTDARQKTKED